jgi:hypothetical protein
MRHAFEGALDKTILQTMGKTPVYEPNVPETCRESRGARLVQMVESRRSYLWWYQFSSSPFPLYNTSASLIGIFVRRCIVDRALVLLFFSLFRALLISQGLSPVNVSHS